MIEGKEDLFLQCSCYSPEHLVCFTFIPAEEKSCPDDYGFPAQIYLSVQMPRDLGFFKRLWIAIKYVIRPRDWKHWDETIIDVEQAVVLRQYLDKTILTSSSNG